VPLNHLSQQNWCAYGEGLSRLPPGRLILSAAQSTFTVVPILPKMQAVVLMLFRLGGNRYAQRLPLIGEAQRDSATYVGNIPSIGDLLEGGGSPRD